MTEDLENPFEPAPRSGLPPRQFRALNEARQCSAPGCTEKRDDVTPLCERHYRRFCSYGSLTKKHIDAGDLYNAKQRTRRILDRALEARHPSALAGVEGIRRLLAPGSFIHREAKHAYLARVAATADPKEVIVETAAVLLCLYRFDPDGYADGDYLATQITTRLRKLGPRRYVRGGDRKSVKRSKACAGAVLDVIGPLCALMVSVLERDRKRLQQQRATAQQRRATKSTHQQGTQHDEQH